MDGLVRRRTRWSRGSGWRYRLDLAYPELRPAIQYDGELHRTRLRAHADLLREADLTRLGWTILRFDAHTALHQPDHIADAVRAAIRGDRRERDTTALVAALASRFRGSPGHPARPTGQHPGRW